MKKISYKGVLDEQLDGIYRVEKGVLISGKSRHVFIHNGGYYLTKIGIYADGIVDCWGLIEFSEFKKKLEKGWVTTFVPNDTTVDVHLLSSMTIHNANHFISPKELVKEVEDTLALLNGRPSTLELCRNAYDSYLGNPTAENEEMLKKAYYAMPEHMRHFVLGDMEAKDSPITRIIDKSDL